MRRVPGAPGSALQGSRGARPEGPPQALSALLSVPRAISLHLQTRGQGPAVLLLHGFNGSADAWGPAILDGLARTHRVLALDLPGHGKSDAPDAPAGYALEAVVEALGRLLGELNVARAHWVGYSMGGRIALGAAVLAPERVERLVLESASPGLADEAERRARREQDEALARRLETEGTEPFVDAWEALPLFGSQRRLPSSVRDAQRQRRLLGRPAALAACLRGLGTGAQPSFWDRLGEVRAPALLLTGEEDARFTAVAGRMAAALPQARHVIVPSAGHAVHLEAPGVWLEAVLPWLQGGEL